MIRVLVATLIATVSGAAAQILMRKGMQVIGPLDSYAPLELVSYFWRALCQPYVILGTVLSAVFYFAFLGILSWVGVTIAVPLSAVEYFFAAVLAVLILGEKVPTLRWIGIALVILGVILISAAGGDGAAPQPASRLEQRTPQS